MAKQGERERTTVVPEPVEVPDWIGDPIKKPVPVEVPV